MPLPEREESVHIADYYQVLVRHKYLIILFLVLSVSLAVKHNSSLIPIYNATTSLIIDKERTKSPVTGQRIDYESYLSETLTFNTHFEMITSLPVMERVVKALNLDSQSGEQHQKVVENIHPFKQYFTRLIKNVYLLKKNILSFLGFENESKSPVKKESRADGLVQSLKGIITVEPIEDTRLLNLTATHSNPILARDIANAAAQAYIDFNIGNRMKASQNTLKWLGENLHETKKNLEKAEEEFSAYKRSARLISIEKSQEMIAQKMRDFNDVYIEARNRRLELEAKLEQLSSIMQSKKDITRFRFLISNPLVDSLYGELIKAEVELTEIGKIYRSKHPKVIQVKTKITDTRKTIQQEIKKELSNLKTERSVLIAREKVIQNTIADFEKEAMETNKLELQHNILQRNVQMNQRIYESLLSSMKEANLVRNLDFSNIRIMEKAKLPRSPIGLNARRNLLLSLVIGFMVGAGLSFFLEYLDRSLKTEEDIKKYLDLPVLGIIPSSGKKDI